MAAQTNPKAKTMPRIRYVHRTRISGRILREWQRNRGRKS
jgi:hypothetical protein